MMQQRIVAYLDGLAGPVAALARLQSESHLRLEQLLPGLYRIFHRNDELTNPKPKT